MIFKKIFKATDSISKKIEIPIPPAEKIQYTIFDDLQDQIDDITDNIENEYYVNYVFDKYDYFISTKPFYFYFEIPLGTVEIASARVSFEVKDYRNSSLTDSRYAITGDSEARPKITFYISEDKGCKFGSAYGQYETDMRAIDISGDLTGQGIKIVKFTTDNDVCISARIFLKLKVTKIEPLGRPEIRTLPATSITSSSATLNGDIIKVGSGNVIDRTTGEITPINTCSKRGFKWATTKADTNNKSETGSFVKGKYSLDVTELTSETDYYFRAFADNPLKIFGEYLKFTTLWAENTTSAYDKKYPQFQVIGDKIYLVWQEYDGSKWQIWTAVIDTDGSDFVATKRTTSAYNKALPQLEVDGSKIYYVWYEDDGDYNQIWTAISDLDGSDFVATKRTTSAYNKIYPQLEVVDDLIYYIWNERTDEGYPNEIAIATGKMNINGIGWTAIDKLTSSYYVNNPQFQIVGSEFYIIYSEYSGGYGSIRVAKVNIDSGASSWQRKTDPVQGGYYYPQFQATDSGFDVVWSQQISSGSDYYIYTVQGTMGMIGWMTEPAQYWSPVQKRQTSNEIPNIGVYSNVQLQVVNGEIYYVWFESDGSKYQIWTATFINNTWTATKKTTSAYDKKCPQFQVVGSKIYYVWSQYDGTNYQIHIE